MAHSVTCQGPSGITRLSQQGNSNIAQLRLTVQLRWLAITSCLARQATQSVVEQSPQHSTNAI